MCVFLALATQFASAETALADDPILDGAFQTLATLELGQDLNLLAPIRQAVAGARSDPQARSEIEARLIALLRTDATDLAKDYACRQLAIVGSDAAVAALSEWLPNARLSYMARYGLEGIGGTVATTALREMLAQTTGQPRIGIVISLGRLADPQAVSAISALLDAEDFPLCEASLIALGRIGTVAAAEALERFTAAAPARLQAALVDAKLDAADSLCQQGRYPEATRICESLKAAESERIRAAAFRGLIAASPSESSTMTIAGLAADEPWKRAVAADCVRDLREPERIQAIADSVASLPISGKLAALASLQGRGHPAVRDAALAALDQTQVEVCTTALEALIAAGTAKDVSMLAELASTAESPLVRDAAQRTLRLMTAAGTDQAIMSLVKTSQDLPPAIVQVALGRRSPTLLPVFLEAVKSPTKATRLEAFKALEIMATADDATSLVKLLVESPPGDEREAAGRAVWISCQGISDPAERTAPLLAAMDRADGAAQCAILPTLARMGGPKALAAVHTAMQSEDLAVRDAAHRAIANWPDATVADELLSIAKSSPVEAYRIWALRAYARVVSLPSERPAQQTFVMLKQAMDMATRVEDRELFITRFEAVRVPEALALLLSYLDDPELKDAAAAAVFTLAKGLSQTHPVQAAAALQKILPLTKDEAILQQIPKVLRDIEARKATE